jgi:hypothetical protein
VKPSIRGCWVILEAIMKLNAKMSTKLAIVTGLLSAAGLTSHSRASLAHSGTQDEQMACTPDVLTLCLFDIPNEERIVACLNRNLAQLSPACRAVIEGPSQDKKERAKS